MNISEINKIFRKYIIKGFFIEELTNLDFKKSNIKCKALPIKSHDYVTIAKQPKYSVLDSTKISKDYDINPKKWTESLENCINETN